MNDRRPPDLRSPRDQNYYINIQNFHLHWHTEDQLSQVYVRGSMNIFLHNAPVWRQQ